jgi:Putative adhesin
MSAGYVAERDAVDTAAHDRAGGRYRITRWGIAVIVSAAVLVAAAAAMGALWLATSGTRTSEYLAAAEVQRIEIDVGDGNVTIIGGGLDEVAVRRTDHYAYDRSPSEWRTQESGVVRISSRCPSLVIGSCAADYHLTVSNNVPVTVRVERGDVRLANYRGSADLEARAGSITVNRFCGFVLQAATKQGDIDASTSCSAERLELRTDTGNVHAIVPRGRYRVDADTNAGTVIVRGITQAFEAPWEIQALSSSGDVTVERAP